MKSYTHFTLSERNCLQQFLSEGKGVREIGRLMGRSASSISREIKRNCKDKKRYNAWWATSLYLADLIGLDVCLAIMELLRDEMGEGKYRPAPLLRKMVRAGKLGRKSGEGFFRY